MTPPTPITPVPAPDTTKTRAPDVYTVAPGYHVSFLAGAADPPAPFDLIEVVATHRGGPPPQRHAGTTWFHVLEGHLQIFGGQSRSAAAMDPAFTRANACGPGRRGTRRPQRGGGGGQIPDRRPAGDDRELPRSVRRDAAGSTRARANRLGT